MDIEKRPKEEEEEEEEIKPIMFTNLLDNCHYVSQSTRREGNRKKMKEEEEELKPLLLCGVFRRSNQLRLRFPVASACLRPKLSNCNFNLSSFYGTAEFILFFL